MNLPSRNYTAFARYLIDGITPPLIRDSFIFEGLAGLYSTLEHSRERDISDEAITSILDNLTEGTSILEAGAGHGYLLDILRGLGFDATGLDLNPPQNKPYIIKGDITNPPFSRGQFETTICANTLEHIPNLNAAIFGLRWLTTERIIIVVPKQRPYLYTFDEHIHFFPYTSSLVSAINPKNPFKCFEVGAEQIFYMEDLKP